MKLFKNLLIATAAVAVFTGVSAFAEEATDNTNYNFTVDATKVSENVVSVTSTEVANVIADMGDQVTVVVVPAGSTEITDANIYYINQDANGNATVMLTNMGTKTLEANTDYEVWVGGSNGTIKKGFFTTKEDEPPVVYGELNGTDPVDIEDALVLLNYCAQQLTLTPEQLVAAELNGTDPVDIEDALLLLNYCAQQIDKFPVQQ